jgi:TrmH family RNA methyltransferase
MLAALRPRPVRAISSAANPRFRAWLALATSARAVREQKRTLAEGVHLAQAVRAHRWPVESVLLRRGVVQPQVLAEAESIATQGCTVFELAADLYDRLAPVQHGCGLLLVVPTAEATAPLPAGDAIFLDGIQDPGNAGALVRVAAAAGVTHVLAGDGTAALWSPRALRAGQGGHFAVLIAESVAVGALRDRFPGPWIGATARQAESLWQAALPPGPLGWMFGAEGQGLSDQALGVCVQRLKIPLEPTVESLNVVSAAAVCLFERRRRLDRGYP